MASAIDDTVPATHADLISAPVRANFVAAKSEITALQNAIAATPSIYTITLTATQISALGATNQTVINAPGAGKTIVITQGQFVYKKNGGLGLSSVISSLTFFVGGKKVRVDNTMPINQDAEATENQPLLFGFDESSSIVYGAIATSTLGGGGAGFVIGDTFTVDVEPGASGGTAATGVVDTVDVGGVILTYHLTTGGNAYLRTTGSAITATSGIGAGAYIAINTLDCTVNPVTAKVVAVASIV